jgi:hypothetical protein
MIRRAYYTCALERARQVNKPLMVIGDPDNGIASIYTGADYGCGDICVDLTGCPTCSSRSKVMKGRLEELVKGIDFSKYVVYISCVLEYTDDLPLILQRMQEVNPDELFIVSVEWYSWMAFLYPYYLTGERPPKYIRFNQKYTKNPFFFE